jgi:hypothetical protein
VCTTNPAAGRGVTTSLLQARQLIALLEVHGLDFTSCSLAFDYWCSRHIKPWFEDHVSWDADLIRRWSGHDVDLTRPLPPDLIMAAAQADPGIAEVAGPYQAMLALPSSLDAVQARARDIYATGWRPPMPPGPTRDELASLVTAAASSRSHLAQDAALPPSGCAPSPGAAARPRWGILRRQVACPPAVSAPGGHGMILIQRSVDIGTRHIVLYGGPGALEEQRALRGGRDDRLVRGADAG